MKWLRLLLGMSALLAASAGAAESFLVCVSNERSGEITLIDGLSHKVLATIPVGKRPRGVHPSPDGKLLYVALSGSPISGPPPLDAQGNPIQKPDNDDDDKADHSADGIGIVDLVERKFIRKISGGSDPEEFAVSLDGRRLYTSNEDVGTASVVNIGTAKVEHIIPVKKEPEGVSLTPDGKFVYVTCETGGEIFVIDTARNKIVAEFTVGGRPRTVAFLPDASRAFIPSESSGALHLVDGMQHKVIQSVQLPAGSRPMGTAVSADGKRLYVSTGRGGTICIVNTSNLEVLGTIKVGPRPWGIGLAPDGKKLFVANGPSNDVSVVDLETQKEIGRIKAGEGPWGIAIVKN